MSTVSPSPVPTEQRVPKEATPGFWQRYSYRGEMPWSAAGSLAMHAITCLVIMLCTIQLTKPTVKPPTVDTVRVSDASESAAGDSSDSADGGLEAAAAPEEAAVPPTPPSEQVQEVKPVAPNAVAPSDTTLKQEISDTVSEGVSAAKNAKANLAKKVGKNMGEGKGGGGGTDAEKRGGRPARWILRFNTRSAPDYMAQFEGLGATVAFPKVGDRYVYYSNLTSGSPTAKEQDISSEGRLFWIDDRPESYRNVARACGMPNAPFMVAFLPLELEQKMLKLELAYMNLEEDDIQSTQFEVVRRGGGFDVIVVEQTPK